MVVKRRGRPSSATKASGRKSGASAAAVSSPAGSPNADLSQRFKAAQAKRPFKGSKYASKHVAYYLDGLIDEEVAVAKHPKEVKLWLTKVRSKILRQVSQASLTDKTQGEA